MRSAWPPLYPHLSEFVNQSGLANPSGRGWAALCGEGTRGRARHRGRASRSDARTTGARSGAVADWCREGAALRVPWDSPGPSKAEPSHTGHGDWSMIESSGRLRQRVL